MDGSCTFHTSLEDVDSHICVVVGFFRVDVAGVAPSVPSIIAVDDCGATLALGPRGRVSTATPVHGFGLHK